MHPAPLTYTLAFLATHCLGVINCTVNCQLIVIWHMDTRGLLIIHVELLSGALHTSLFEFSFFLKFSAIQTPCVAANNMYIYAFIALHMHKIVFKHIYGLHMHISNIFMYSYILYMKIPYKFRHCTHNTHTKHYSNIVTDTKVHFTQLEWLQSNKHSLWVCASPIP